LKGHFLQFSSNDAAKILGVLADKPKDAKITVAFSDIHAYEKFSCLFQEIFKQYPHTRLRSLDYFLSRYLEERKINHNRVCKGEILKEYVPNFDKPITYAREWYKHPDTGHDLTEYNGLSLGRCVEMNDYYFFQAVLTCTVDVEVYLKFHHTDILIHAHSGRFPIKQQDPRFPFDIFYDLLPFLCRKEKIEFFSVGYPASRVTEILRSAWGKMKIGSPIKIGGLNIRLPKPLFSILKNILLLGKNAIAWSYYDSQRRNILFANATAASYFGQSAMKTLSEKEDFNVFVLNGESRQHKVINILPVFSLRYLVLCVKKILLRNKFRKRLKAHRDRLKQRTSFYNSSFFELYPFYFKDIYLNLFPDLAVYAEYFRSCLRKNKIAAVITQSDLPPHERAAVLTANACSIPTIHLQHGYEASIVGPAIKFPRIARYQFVWGKTHATILGEKIKKEQIKIVGYTNLELLAPPQEVSWPDMDRPGTMVLIMHWGTRFSFDANLSLEENELLVKISMEMIRAFPAKTLVIKLRPGDVQIEVYHDLIHRSGLKNARIEATTNLSLLLKQCDLYLHVESTGALEGMALNKQGIRFSFIQDNKKLYTEQIGYQTLFAEYETEAVVDKPTPESLISAVQAIYKPGRQREIWLTERARFLEDYINYRKGDPVHCFAQSLQKCL